MLNRLFHPGPFWSLELLPTHVIHLLIDVNNTQEIEIDYCSLKVKIREIHFTFAHDWRRIISSNRSGFYKPQILCALTHIFVVLSAIWFLKTNITSDKLATTWAFHTICCWAITWHGNNWRLQLGPYFGPSLPHSRCIIIIIISNPNSLMVVVAEEDLVNHVLRTHIKK